MPLSRKPEACQGCPAERWGCGFVPPSEPAAATAVPIAIVGQGPGEQEAHTSVPFFPRAPSGNILNQWLHEANLSRSQVWIGNVVQCWLPESHTGGPHGNREPTHAEVEFCWNAHVGKALANFSPRHIVSVGTPATRKLLGLKWDRKSIQRWMGTHNLREIQIVERRHDAGGDPPTLRRHEPQVSGPGESRGDAGTQANSPPSASELRSLRETYTSELEYLRALWEAEGREREACSGGTGAGEPSSSVVCITPLVHPSAILRGGWSLETAQKTYLQRVSSDAKGTEKIEFLDVSKPPEGSQIFPSIEAIREHFEEVRSLGAVSIDIESVGSHIICIGFTSLTPDGEKVGKTICVRFKLSGGGNFWPTKEALAEAVAEIQSVLADPKITKVFQNGITFDIPELLDVGFEVVGPYIDTMHLQHTAYHEMPKGLQFMATLYLSAPVWKSLVDEEEDLEGKS